MNMFFTSKYFPQVMESQARLLDIGGNFMFITITLTFQEFPFPLLDKSEYLVSLQEYNQIYVFKLENLFSVTFSLLDCQWIPYTV